MKDPPPGVNIQRPRAAPSRASAPVITISDEEMDYDDGQAPAEDRRPQQPLRAPLRAEPDVQDGRYGFSETDHRSSEGSYQDDKRNDRRGQGGNGNGSSGLVSDGMLGRDNRNNRNIRDNRGNGNRDNGYYRRNDRVRY